MTFMFTRTPRFLPLLACLSASSVYADITPPTLHGWSASKAQALIYVPGGAGDQRLAVNKRDGMLLLDKQGKTASQIKGSFAGLDSRPLGDQVLVAKARQLREKMPILFASGYAETLEVAEGMAGEDVPAEVSSGGRSESGS